MRPIDADKLHYKKVNIVSAKGTAPAVVVFAKEIDKTAVKLHQGHWSMLSYDEACCSECGYVRYTPFDTTAEARAHWDELPKFCEACGALVGKEPDNGTVY